ncbi:putative KH and PIN-domain containing protein [uncultured archaeon]|nr:putative KH and PIN-domain containing protein [uncultured archaeon]
MAPPKKKGKETEQPKKEEAPANQAQTKTEKEPAAQQAEPKEKPSETTQEKTPTTPTEKKPQTTLKEYDIDSEGVKTHIKIAQEEGKPPLYQIGLPEIDVATIALLDDIKERLITSIDMSTSEVMDPGLFDQLTKEFKAKAETLLAEELPKLDPHIRDTFTVRLIHELIGLEDIEYLLADPDLEEIVINSAQEPVRVYHKKFGWLATNINLYNEEHIKNYANTIGRRVGREITTLSPLLDAHLLTKDRANAIISPISTKGNTITIRKFARDPWTVTDFINNKTASSEVLALLWLMIQYEMNIIISGGTGSGKTSVLNVLMPFIPPNHRIISIEDTRELQLPEFLFWCPLTTREPNPEGKGEITMLQLLINSLRMRPDRIIMGEIRKQREAEVLFEAMHTGHSVYCTVHADTCAQTVTRLTNPPISIPHSMLDSVHLNVVMFRDRRRSIRRIFEVGELLLDEREQAQGVIRYHPHILFAWNPKTDNIEAQNMPKRLFEELQRHTGFSVEEIQTEILQKKRILDYLVEHNLRSIEQVGKIMNLYYLEKCKVIDVVNNNKDPAPLLT